MCRLFTRLRFVLVKYRQNVAVQQPSGDGSYDANGSLRDIHTGVCYLLIDISIGSDCGPPQKEGSRFDLLLKRKCQRAGVCYGASNTTPATR